MAAGPVGAAGRHNARALSQHQPPPPRGRAPCANTKHPPPNKHTHSLETADFALHGLWCVNMMATLDFVATAFNAIRLPFR